MLVAIIGIIPKPQVLADAWIQLFRIGPHKTIALPPCENISATQTHAPAFAMTLAPASTLEAIHEPSSDMPEISDRSLDACADDPYGYFCQMRSAEKRWGHDAKKFPGNLERLVFDTADIYEDVLRIYYRPSFGG